MILVSIAQFGTRGRVTTASSPRHCGNRDRRAKPGARLYGERRLLTVFEAADRCILLLVAEHTRASDCYPESQPPVDADHAAQLGTGTTSSVIAFGTFGVVVAGVAVTLGGAGRNLRMDAFPSRLQDTTAEIRVRIAVALLVGFVALAAKMGLQIILGAFLAGAVLNLVDRDIASHPVFRSKLDALGYGFLIPVFFVSSGVEFDLSALTRSPSALAVLRTRSKAAGWPPWAGRYARRTFCARRPWVPRWPTWNSSWSPAARWASWSPSAPTSSRPPRAAGVSHPVHGHAQRR